MAEKKKLDFAPQVYNIDSQLACTFHASFLQVPMNCLYKAFFDVGITEILLFLITFLVM